MKIFIIHYKKLTERKHYLINNLSDFDYEFIDEFDREDILKFNTMYYKNSELWNERVTVYNDKPIYRDLKDSEICNSLSHIEAMKKIIDEKLEYAVILEDDVIIYNNFNEKINHIINNIPKDFDFVFFGTSYSMDLLDRITSDNSIFLGNNLWKKEPGITRTVDAYIISNKAAKIIVDNISEIVLPFDFELTYL